MTVGGPGGPCWISICGLPSDATARELHVLFSSCAGYVKSKLAIDSSEVLAVVQFVSPEDTIEALYSRNGTSWFPDSDPVELELWDGPGNGQMPQPVSRSPTSPSFPKPCSPSDDVLSQCTEDSRMPAGYGGLSPLHGGFSMSSYRGSPGSQRLSPSTPSTSSRKASHNQRASAQSMIDRAMETRRKGDLETAIQMGQEAGLSEQDLMKPRQALETVLVRAQARQSSAVGNRKQVAQAKLQESMLQFQLQTDVPVDKKMKALKAAIKSAEIAGLDKHAIEEAQQTHDEMEELIAAQQELERQTEDPASATDLRDAIHRAKDAGVSTDVLHRGARQLVVVEKKAKARQVLKTALQEQHKALMKATELRPGQQLSTNLAQVVEEVRRAGLDEEELIDAEEALEVERRFVALLKLEKAKESRSIPALQKAIKEAQRAQADDDLIEEAEEMLREEEQRAMENKMKGRQAFKPAGHSFSPHASKLRSPTNSVFLSER